MSAGCWSYGAFTRRSSGPRSPRLRSDAPHPRTQRWCPHRAARNYAPPLRRASADGGRAGLAGLFRDFKSSCIYMHIHISMHPVHVCTCRRGDVPHPCQPSSRSFLVLPDGAVQVRLLLALRPCACVRLRVLQHVGCVRAGTYGRRTAESTPEEVSVCTAGVGDDVRSACLLWPRSLRALPVPLTDEQSSQSQFEQLLVAARQVVRAVRSLRVGTRGLRLRRRCNRRW